MSFISVLKTIGNDIEKGLELAAPFISLIPGGVAIAPILAEVAQVIGILEQSGQKIDPSVLSAVMQAVTQVHVAKQVPASFKPAVATLTLTGSASTGAPSPPPAQ